MNWDADVYQGPRLVAHFRRTKTGTELVFTEEVAAGRGSLAWTLPYAQEPVESGAGALPPYFLNLLPEGVRLEYLLGANRVAQDDMLGILLLVGRDAIGDVSVVPHGETLSFAEDEIDERTISERSFWEDFYAQYSQRKERGVPGVQEKISHASYRVSARGKVSGPAILKLNPERFERLVENEAFFLGVAKSCGFLVNDWRVVHDRAGESALLVKRFDRVIESGKVRKLHQEDMCQLRGEIPANKYSIPVRGVMETIGEVSTAPAADRLEFLMRYLFSYLIGNNDFHAKNISLIWRERRVEMSPGYDILSSLPYKGQEKNMALKMDGKDDRFKGKDFLAFGSRFGLPEVAVAKAMDRIVRRFEPWVGRFGEMGYSAEVTELVQKECWKRVEAMKP